ncbi:MAG UNVERIFIED_CONTAM: hypothetical protein LVR18_35560 [Planctomycetaceae bacterium]|jgi:membrane-bound serine protease (ClpP class)
MLNRRHQSSCGNLIRLGLMITGLLCVGTTAFAVDEPAPAAAPAATPDAPPAPAAAGAPIGRFLTLPAPLTEASLATLQNALVSLRDRSTTESRPASLVLEIPPDQAAPDLSAIFLSLLTSAEYSAVRLVAWILKPVSGNHAALALACHEIILEPQASLGDLGRGQPLAADDQQFYQSLADSRRNPGLSRGIIRAMLDNSAGLYRVQVRDAAGLEQTRFPATDELQVMRQQPIEILEAIVIREPGNPAQFTADDCQRFGFLSQRTAKNRPEIAELLRLPQEALREDSTAAPRSARLIEIHGAIGTSMGEFARREIRRGLRGKCWRAHRRNRLPGGSKDIAEDIAMLLSDIPAEEMQTVAWIPVAHSAEVLSSPSAANRLCSIPMRRLVTSVSSVSLNPADNSNAPRENRQPLSRIRRHACPQTRPTPCSAPGDDRPRSRSLPGHQQKDRSRYLDERSRTPGTGR